MSAQKADCVQVGGAEPGKWETRAEESLISRVLPKQLKKEREKLNGGVGE